MNNNLIENEVLIYSSDDLSYPLLDGNIIVNAINITGIRPDPSESGYIEFRLKINCGDCKISGISGKEFISKIKHDTVTILKTSKDLYDEIVSLFHIVAETLEYIIIDKSGLSQYPLLSNLIYEDAMIAEFIKFELKPLIHQIVNGWIRATPTS